MLLQRGRPLPSVQFEDRHESLLRHFDRAELAHPLFSFLLLFEQLLFAGDVSPVTLGPVSYTHLDVYKRQLITTVRQVKRLYNPPIEILGVLLTMYDSRLNLTLQVVAEVKKYFPNKVFKTGIPRNVRLSEAPSFGQPIIYFDRVSKGAQAYNCLLYTSRCV